ncbi:MAG: tetratricopeptide repeat protein [Promethearchaeota archaeon]
MYKEVMSNKINGKTAQEWFDEGTQLGKASQHEEAVICFENVLKIDPKFENAQYYLGSVYENKGDFENAIKHCEIAFYDFPDNIEPLKIVARCHVKAGSREKGIETYQRILEVDPQNEDAIYNIGFHYKQLQEYDKAIEHFKKVLDMNENADDAWDEIGGIYNSQKNFEEALKWYEKGLEKNPESGLLLYSKGATLGQMGGKAKEELVCYQKAVLTRPNDHRVWNNMGFALEDLGHKNQAARAWKISDQIKDGARIRDEQEIQDALEIVKYGGLDPVYKGKAANKALERGQRASSQQEALKYFNEAVALYSSVGNEIATANVFKHIAAVYRSMGEWELSLIYEEQALEIHDNNNYEMFIGEEVHNIGVAYQQMEKYKEAIPYYKRSIEIHEKLKDSRRKGDGMYNLGLCLNKTGKYEEAIEIFSACLENDIEEEYEDNQALDYKGLGEAYMGKGNNEKALKHLNKSLKMLEDLGYEREIEKIKKLIENVKR